MKRRLRNFLESILELGTTKKIAVSWGHLRDTITRRTTCFCKCLSAIFLRLDLSPILKSSLIPRVYTASFRNPTRAFRILFRVTHYDRGARSKARRKKERRKKEKRNGMEEKKRTICHSRRHAYPRDTSRTGAQLAVINQRCSDK